MSGHLANIKQLLDEASAAINQVSTIHDLEIIKSKYLGKKGGLTEMLKGLATLDSSERPKAGQIINEAKNELINLLEKRRQNINNKAVIENLNQEAIDITLPPRGQSRGSGHPITKVRRLMEDFFVRQGFVVVEGPEIETDFYNFTALNIPPHHPARTAHDSFYFADNTMLRSQTSPVQIRVMEKFSPPLRIICPGKTFRRDNDATHSPMFHQMEMLMVDKDLSLANLKCLISQFVKFIFNNDIEYRFRPSYFPFTEPSAEVDIKWTVGKSWRWLELGGCGVVHPNVLKNVKIDPTEYRGIAFGLGIERLAMLYYGINDIRLFFENDLQFLEQF
jgi:phenylalanyl-tRNA synthetase alpha chain